MADIVHKEVRSFLSEMSVNILQEILCSPITYACEISSYQEVHYTEVTHYEQPGEHEADLDGAAGAHNQEESKEARPQVGEHDLLTHQIVAEHQEIFNDGDQA